MLGKGAEQPPACVQPPGRHVLGLHGSSIILEVYILLPCPAGGQWQCCSAAGLESTGSLPHPIGSSEADPTMWCSLQLAVAVLPLGFGVSGRGEQEKQRHRQGCGLAVAGCCCSPTASGLPLPSQIPVCAT